MILSDRDIRAHIDSGRIVIDPFDPDMIQPASIDIRLDRYFRLFDNHKYPHIDPAEDQPDCWLIETAGVRRSFCIPEVRARQRSGAEPGERRSSPVEGIIWDDSGC